MADVLHKIDWNRSEIANARNENRRIEKKVDKEVQSCSMNRASGIWKAMCVTLLGILATGLAAWVSFGGGLTKADGKQLEQQIVTAVNAVMAEHVRQPHQGAVRRDEYELNEKANADRLDRIENKIDSLITRTNN